MTDAASTLPAPTAQAAKLPPLTSAERMRRSRERKRKGLRYTAAVLSQIQIEGLIRCGWLARSERWDAAAVRKALACRLADNLGGAQQWFWGRQLRVTVAGRRPRSMPYQRRRVFAVLHPLVYFVDLRQMSASSPPACKLKNDFRCRRPIAAKSLGSQARGKNEPRPCAHSARENWSMRGHRPYPKCSNISIKLLILRMICVLDGGVSRCRRA